MPKITVLPHPELAPEGAELNVPVGTSICEALLDNGIEIEHACDMSCACTTCHCIINRLAICLRHPCHIINRLGTPFYF